MASRRFLIRVHPCFIRGAFLFDFPLLRISHEYQHNPWPDVDYCSLFIRPWRGAADAHAKVKNIPLRLPNGESRPRQNGTEPRASSSFPSSRLQVRPSSSFAGPAASDPGERAKVSLTMIVRDEDAEFWFRKAVVHRHRGESAKAENNWRRILRPHRPDQFCSFDQGIYGHLTRRNLAALSAECGDHAEARQL